MVEVVMVQVECGAEDVSLWVVETDVAEALIENRPVHNVVPGLVDNVICPFEGEVEAHVVDEHLLGWTCPLCGTAHEMDKVDPDDAADLLAERGW
jgi:hypothetical protein